MKARGLQFQAEKVVFKQTWRRVGAQATREIVEGDCSRKWTLKYALLAETGVKEGLSPGKMRM